VAIAWTMAEVSGAVRWVNRWAKTLQSSDRHFRFPTEYRQTAAKYAGEDYECYKFKSASKIYPKWFFQPQILHLWTPKSRTRIRNFFNSPRLLREWWIAAACAARPMQKAVSVIASSHQSPIRRVGGRPVHVVFTEHLTDWRDLVDCTAHRT